MFTHPIAGASHAAPVSVIWKADGTSPCPGDMVTSTTTGHTYTVVSLNGGNRFTMKLGESEFDCIILGKGVHDCPHSFFIRDDGFDVSRGTAHCWKIHIGFRTGTLRLVWSLTPKWWPRGVTGRPLLRSMVSIRAFNGWNGVLAFSPSAIAQAASPVVGSSAPEVAPACPAAAPVAAASSGPTGAVSSGVPPAVATLTFAVVNELNEGKLHFKVKITTSLKKVIKAYEMRTGRFGLCLWVGGKGVIGGTCQYPKTYSPWSSSAPIQDGDTVKVVAPFCSISWDKKFVPIKVDGEEYLMRSDRAFGELFAHHVKKKWAADQIGQVRMFMAMRGKPSLKVENSHTPAGLYSEIRGAENVYMFTRQVIA